MAYSRNRYLKALGIRKQIVDPPYYFVSQKIRLRILQSRSEKERIARREKVSIQTTEQWFTCLRPYLADLESTSESKLEHIIVAAYVDNISESVDRFGCSQNEKVLETKSSEPSTQPQAERNV